MVAESSSLLSVCAGLMLNTSNTSCTAKLGKSRKFGYTVCAKIGDLDGHRPPQEGISQQHGLQGQDSAQILGDYDWAGSPGSLDSV